MKIVNFGGGGIGHGIDRYLRKEGIVDRMVFAAHPEVDVVSTLQVRRFCDAVNLHSDDWVICTAGVDDEDDPIETIAVNLIGSLTVAREATSLGASVILLASLAGLYGKPGHVAYCASKAGVISIVESLGFDHKIWAISPGRVDTPMRDRRYPNDTPGSRLDPESIGMVVMDIMQGFHPSGSNIIYRLVGNDAQGKQLEYYREDNPWGERLGVGRPVTV